MFTDVNKFRLKNTKNHKLNTNIKKMNYKQSKAVEDKSEVDLVDNRCRIFVV